MKEIYEQILKEKSKQNPNKEYIQFLQQMLDAKESAEYLVKEVKQTKFLDQLYLDNTINLEDYFKYSKR